MVCQNQSIDDSDAPLARDLRVLVRERLRPATATAQVIDFLVTRYGEFVLLKPRFTGRTALLWLMPVLVLLIGAVAFVAWRRCRRQRARFTRCRERPADAGRERAAFAHPRASRFLRFVLKGSARPVAVTLICI